VNSHGEGLRGNREVSQVVILGASRGVPEEGVHGGTWFPQASEVEGERGGCVNSHGEGLRGNREVSQVEILGAGRGVPGEGEVAV
jgi:hypothetical protein